MLPVSDSDPVEIVTRNTSSGIIKAWLSSNDEDSGWDDFLAQTPMGQFQQSSSWAQVKKTNGWRHLRVLITRQSIILGGFQILLRAVRYLGTIGYVNKGPVIQGEDPAIIEFTLGVMVELARKRKLSALMVQPPDNSSTLPSFFAGYGFSPDYNSNIITANLIVDVSKGIEAVEECMRAHTKQEIRQGLKRGISIREGSENEIDIFFRLMLSSCKRQGVKPNPSSESSLNQMWRAFHTRRQIRLTLAEYQDEPVAGLLSVPFGERVTFWKKGWSDLHSNLRPNHLLYYEAFQWAKSNGYKFCDFAGLSPQIAVSLLQGRTLSTEEKKTRDFFNLGFGGSPVLLPPACVYITNHALRWTCCRIIPRGLRFPLARNLLRRISSG